MSSESSLVVLFDLTRRLFSDDAATRAAEGDFEAIKDAVSPAERAVVMVARPVLAVSTPLLMLATAFALLLAAGRWEQLVLVVAAVALPVVVAWPARALRRLLKRALLRVVVGRARARMTVNTRALFAASATHDEVDRLVEREAVAEEHTRQPR